MKLADIELLTTTTESPMVSATAVAAVRSGLEQERVGGEAPAGREQAPRTARRAPRTTGMIRNGAAIAMPANIAIVSTIPP